MFTTEEKSAITPLCWFYILYIRFQNETNWNLPSRVEIVFLLDSGEIILVLNIPPCMMITQMFNVWSHDQHDTSKTMTIANQSEVSFKLSISATCFSSIETKWRYFMIPFAATDVKYFILGAPFVEKFVQNIKIQDFTMNSNISSMINPQLLFLPR